MLFRCEDLEKYVKETSQEKMNMILINKADFLSEKQRQHWAEYFDSKNLPVAFFSALEENQNNQLRKMKIEEEDEVCDDEDDNNYEDVNTSDECDAGSSEATAANKETETVTESQDRTKDTVGGALGEEEKTNPAKADGKIKNSTRLLNRDELIHLFKTIHKGVKVQDGRSVVGLVGYPNVGKSSTINSLLTHKKVSVSATPGKTKHFQV